MKLSISLASLLVVMAPAAFASSMCQAPYTTVSTCVADATVPEYPFVDICKNNDQYIMMMDEGGLTTPDSGNVQKTETATNVVYAATDADMDNLKMTFPKVATGKVKAVLSYDMFSYNSKSNYTCTISN